MSRDSDDRLVQTAVLGRRDSWEPALMPRERQDALLVVDGFKRMGLWCGDLLGGCGQQLTTKVGEIRVPHFSHFPDPTGMVTCARTRTGRTSADHLFLSRDLGQWLRSKGRKTEPPKFSGDMKRTGCQGISLRQSDGHGMMAIALETIEDDEWEERDAQFQAEEEWVNWLFGPSVMPPQSLIDREGYVLRVKVEDEALTRRTLLGVQAPRAPIAYRPFADYSLAEWGISDPAIVRARDLAAQRKAKPSRQGRKQLAKKRATRLPPPPPRMVRAMTARETAALTSETLSDSQPIGSILEHVTAAILAKDLPTALRAYESAKKRLEAAITPDPELLKRLRACKSRLDELQTPRPRAKALSVPRAQFDRGLAEIRAQEDRLDVLVRLLQSDKPGQLARRVAQIESILAQMPRDKYPAARAAVARFSPRAEEERRATHTVRVQSISKRLCAPPVDLAAMTADVFEHWRLALENLVAIGEAHTRGNRLLTRQLLRSADFHKTKIPKDLRPWYSAQLLSHEAWATGMSRRGKRRKRG